MTHDELMQKHHKILGKAGYLGVNDGWLPIIDQLCNTLQNMSDSDGLQIEAVQVKEKFGGLRFYVSQYDPNVEGLISKAEAKASKTCDVCGKDGKSRNINGWIATRCDEHAK